MGRLPVFLAAMLFFISVGLLADRAWPGDVGTTDPCAEPLGWHLGDVDPRFGLDRARLRQAVEEAAAIWEDAADRPLFRYTPGEGMAVHLVYDERQEAYTRRRAHDSELAELRQAVEWRASRLERLKGVLGRDSAAFAEDPDREKSARYRASVERYNREVARYNQATARYNRAAAEAEAAGPRQLRVGSLQREDRTLGGRTVEVRRTLTVAAVGDYPQLLLTLTHELGHALGLDHVPAPGAVMAASYRDPDVAARPRLQPADREALDRLCRPAG